MDALRGSRPGLALVLIGLFAASLAAHETCSLPPDDGDEALDEIAQAIRGLGRGLPEAQDLAAAIAALKAEKKGLLEEIRRAGTRKRPTPPPEELERLASERSKLERSAKKERAVAAEREKARLAREMGVVGIETIVDHGDPAKRLDIVILGDGWTGKEIEAYRKACATLAQGFAEKVYPFHLYASYLNVHRIDVVSRESGVSREGKPLDTVFKSRLDTDGILGSSGEVAAGYVALARDADIVVILVNTGEGRSTGGGGYITLAKSGLNEVAFHEMGHAFGGLADEYSDKVLEARRDFSNLERAVNVTLEPDPLRVKWRYWNVPEEIFRGRSDPKGAFPLDKRVGTVEGGAYKSEGVWRPRPSCRMRNSGDPFCEVCAEAMERKFFAFVPIVDDPQPRTFRQTLFAGERIRLSMRLMDVRPEALARLDARNRGDAWETEWYIDGRPAGDGKETREGRTALTVQGSRLDPGLHTISCQVDYINPRIRRDGGFLTGSASWEVEVLPFKKPRIAAPLGRLRARAGETLEFSVTAEAFPEKEGVVFDVLDLPRGASYKEGVFTWTPAPDQHGAHEVAFAVMRPSASERLTGEALYEALRDEVAWLRAEGTACLEARCRNGGDREVLLAETVRIDVARPEGTDNRPPRIAFQAFPEGREGEALLFNVWAHDPDGDHILFEAKNLPEGARLDPRTGMLEWLPTFTQSGVHADIEIRVTDGVLSERRTFDLVVKDHPLTPGVHKRAQGNHNVVDPAIFGRSADIILGLRSPHVPLRAASLAYLENYPVEMQIREAGRLLRDDVPAIREAALVRLERLVTVPQKGGKELPPARPAGYREGEEEGKGPETGPPAPAALRLGVLLQALSTEKGTHAWRMHDFPRGLEWIRSVCDGAATCKEIRPWERKAARRIARNLATIDAYNRRCLDGASQ